MDSATDIPKIKVKNVYKRKRTSKTKKQSIMELIIRLYRQKDATNDSSIKSKILAELNTQYMQLGRVDKTMNFDA
jgi:hypothetical protein